MVWTPGHIWETVKPIVTSTPRFKYKYALLDGENGKEQELICWEKGIDRLAELALLPATGGYESSSNLKHVHLDDEWEKFKVAFSVYYPTDSPYD